MPPDPELVALAGASPDPGTFGVIGGEGDDIARRARNWYLEAVSHPLWTSYTKAADEDEGYYVGGKGQWSLDGSTQDYEALKAAGRAVVSLNHIRPAVRIVLGLEQGTRFDLKAVAQAEDDPEEAQLFSWLLKWAQTRAGVTEALSEQFQQGVIRGLSCLAVDVDREDATDVDDLVHGRIVVEVLTPGIDKEIIWDPYWKRYDLSDARYVLRYRWAWIEDVLARWPEKSDEIRLALTRPSTPTEHKTTEGPPADAYAGVGAGTREIVDATRLFYDPEGGRVLLLEAWYRVYQPIWFVLDDHTANATPMPSAEHARMAAQADPDRLTAVRRLRRQIRLATVLPHTLTTLEDGPGYPNDPTYPFVPYIAERMGDHIWGMVRDLKDPQRIENKRLSHALDIADKFANPRRVYVEGSVANPDALRDTAATDPIAVRRGEQFPGWDVPNLAPVVAVLTALAVRMEDMIRDTSGVHEPLEGQQSSARSGIAIARLQAQGQVIQTSYFAALERTRKLVGQRLAARVQQIFTTERIVRLTDEVGRAFLLRINPAEASGLDEDSFRTLRERLAGEGKPRLLRKVDALKYDLEIVTVPASPSARLASLTVYLDLVEKLPALLPILIDKIVDLLDPPDKAEVLQRLQALQPPQITGTPPSGAAPGAATRLLTAAAGGLPTPSPMTAPAVMAPTP